MGDSTENTNELDSYGVWVKRPPQDSNEDTIFPETEVPAEPLDEALTEDGSFDIPDFGEIPSENSEPGETDGSQDIDIDSFGDFSSENGEETEISMDDFLDDSGSGQSSSEDGEISLDDFMGGSSGDGEISLDDFLDGDSFGSDSGKPQKEDDVGNDEALDIKLDFDPPENEVVPTEEIIEETDYDSEEEFDSDSEESVQKDINESSSVDVGPMEEVSLDDFSLDESDAASADAAAAAVAGAAENGEENSADGASGSFAAPKKTVIDYDLAITEDDEISSSPSIKEIKTDANAEEKETSTESTAVNNELLERIISDLSGLKSEISTLKNDLAILKDRESFEKEPGFPVDKEGSGVVAETAEEEPSGFFNNSDEDETIALSGDELTNIMNSADFTEEVVDNTGISAEPEIVENEEAEIPEYISDDEIAQSSTEEETSEEPQEEPFSAAEETIGSESAFETASELSESEKEEIPADGIPSDNAGDIFESVSSEDQVSSEDMFSEAPSFEQFEVPEEDKTDGNIPETENFSGTPDIQTEDFSSDEIPETIPEDIIDEPVLSESSETSSGDFEEDFPSLPEESFGEENTEQNLAESEFGGTENGEPFISEMETENASDAEEEQEPELRIELEDAGEDIEEPVFENVEDNLPEEIDIPKVDNVASADEEKTADDIMVASSNSDFMDSVSTDEPMISEEPLVSEETETQAENSQTEESELEILEEPEIVENEEPVISEDLPSLEEPENPAEETLDFEPKPASDMFKDEIMEEPPTVEEAITDENIDYLKEDSESLDDSSASESKAETPSAENKGDLPEDIKADVKSVLLYMDQLLENLPEEKIMEFAKSEQFATYKKLFNELGLS